jgi:predicted CopG family antitoxin
MKRFKLKHVAISETNYEKLKSLGKMGDSFDKVLGELLLKNEVKK